MIRLLQNIANPYFECQDCTGTGAGCYCQYYSASAPGVGPTRLQRIAMRILRWWKRLAA